MKKDKKIIKFSLVGLCVIVMIFLATFTDKAVASKTIELIVDGENITEMANPVIKDGRSLVPIRAITEKLGGDVSWDGENRIVKIKRDGQFITLNIDSRLISYGDVKKTYALSDTAPVIIDDHTYVPLRLVSNALEIEVTWNEKERNIYVDSKVNAEIVKQFDMEIITPVSGQLVEGEIPLQVVMGDIKNEAKEIKYLLLDPTTAKGFIIARGELLTGEYLYSPKIEDSGEKVIVAALYDTKGKFIAGDAMGVNVKPKAKVILEGIKEGELIEASVNLKPNMNFSPKYVKYEINNLYKEDITLTEPMDPYGTYTFSPQVHESGDYEFKLIAYDEANRAYESQKIKAKIYPANKLVLSGVRPDMIINKPVNLGAIRNFHVTETQFVLVDSKTREEEILETIPYGNYTWLPGVEYKGDKEILVRVKDTKGQSHESEPIKVYLEGKPQVIIKGVGPKQVITSEVEVSFLSNVNLDSVEYILENPKTGAKKSLKTMTDYKETFKFLPTEKDSGDRIFKAIYKYKGETIRTENIPVKIYLGKTYGPRAIIEKDKFIDFAAKFASETYLDTNMSAAFQTAQAIHETGWGQYIPTDKYSGKMSNNLFGVKGKADAGSVISNTWEEYNGTVYRIDAEFRAYNNPKDSWDDHQSLLLVADRYSIFRDVMYDSTKGAWAVRRAGYATDSAYSMKLINIIDLYNLRELDKLGI